MNHLPYGIWYILLHMRGYLMVLLALPLLAQHEDEKKEKFKHPAFSDPQAIAAGKKLFATSCAACHGAGGQGGRGPNLVQRGVWHPLEEEALFKTIQKGVPGADMPPTNLPEDQIWQLAAYVRSLTAPAIESPLPGDPSAGEALYQGKGGCPQCHRIRGRGGMLGPDLSNAGALRPLEALRESIVDPDADGFPGYRGVTVMTKDGRTIQGVARNRTNYSLQILDQKGELHLLDMRAVKELKLSAHSPMPRDYSQRFSRREIDDLLAFLSRQTTRPHEPPAGASENSK